MSTLLVWIIVFYCLSKWTGMRRFVSSILYGLANFIDPKS